MGKHKRTYFSHRLDNCLQYWYYRCNKFQGKLDLTVGLKSYHTESLTVPSFLIRVLKVRNILQTSVTKSPDTKGYSLIKRQRCTRHLLTTVRISRANPHICQLPNHFSEVSFVSSLANSKFCDFGGQLMSQCVIGSPRPFECFF